MRTRWIQGVVGVIVLVVLGALFFPWDWLRGPLNRYVSAQTGRAFEITRRLDVKLGSPTRIYADGIEFANPGWAKNPYLVKAEAAEIHVRLWPLVAKRQVILPLVKLTKPALALEQDAQGQRSWALTRDDKGASGVVPEIGDFIVDDGRLEYRALHDGTDIAASFSLDGPSTPSGNADTGTGSATATLPLAFQAQGQWRRQPFNARGRTGDVLVLSGGLRSPFPAQVDVSSGPTRLRAEGTVASLSDVEGAKLRFSLNGRSLSDLHSLTGVVLPATSPYSVEGRLAVEGKVSKITEINGRMGRSDVTGALTVDRGAAVPFLSGSIQSRVLDFDDLGPVIGIRGKVDRPRRGAPVVTTATQDGPSIRAEQVANVGRKARAPRDPSKRVLPDAKIDLARLRSMDADVRYAAARMTNVYSLPLDRLAVHVKLRQGVLDLNSLDMGIAGGSVKGTARFDGRSDPVNAKLDLTARSLELNRMFADSNLGKSNYGKIHGDIDLAMRGNSVARMLGSSSGEMTLLMGRGQISNLLLEFAGLDGAEIIKFLLGGDRTVGLRCAATSFGVERGLMTSRAFVLDTVDTVVEGGGRINLADETLDLDFRPKPKDVSILSLRSPLHVGGTLGAPTGSVDKGSLLKRAGLAVALGAINPLLALAATVETGPGKDSDCGELFRSAGDPASARQAVKAGTPASSDSGEARMGAAPSPSPSNPSSQRGAEAAGRAQDTKSGPAYPLERRSR